MSLERIDSVLIANRGEIAVRVIRSAKELGLRTIAVYSELDRDALHVNLADEAWNIGPAPAAESYLNIQHVLDVATESKAAAIHPGYGFLSENADFAEAVSEAGIAWVGPPPDAIRIMGDKISSRKAAIEAGAPTVPGTPSPRGHPAGESHVLVPRSFCPGAGSVAAGRARLSFAGPDLQVVCTGTCRARATV